VATKRNGSEPPLRFEWNPRKAAENLRKHGVAFEEATTVFFDPLSRTIADPDHSDDEPRFVTLGLSVRHNLLVVVHTERGDRIRIISARRATRKEKVKYEKGLEDEN
jgi:uncharacterized DUF497 family protein